MRVLPLLIFLMLPGCAASPPERDWNNSFSPYGKWKSDLGFTIDIMRDGKYTVCDGGLCSAGKYNRDSGAIPDADLVLVNFQKLESTKRLISEADVIIPCDDQFCGAPNAHYDWHNDTHFYDNVANVAHRRICGGDRECIILGNVETAEGMFYKVRQY